jgi:hypothetical protein
MIRHRCKPFLEKLIEQGDVIKEKRVSVFPPEKAIVTKESLAGVCP